MQPWCHLAEDSELAGSQPLAEVGTWRCCYDVLLLSKAFTSPRSLENTYRSGHAPQKHLTALGAPNFSCQGLGQQLGLLGLKGLGYCPKWNLTSLGEDGGNSLSKPGIPEELHSPQMGPGAC